MNKLLPQYCYTVLIGTNRVVKIVRGFSGYCETDINSTEVKKINEVLGVSLAIEKSMVAGSMFGWDSDLADPASYTKGGKLRAKLKKQFEQKYNL